MDLTPLFKRAGKIAADNSPAILTAIGVTGTLATAYLAAKGAFKSVDVLKDGETDKKKNLGEGFDEEIDGALTTQEKFDLTWKLYSPAAVSAALTVTAIICAARINDRRTAAVASAYSVVEKSYAEYRAKAVEKAGKKREQDIRDSIAQDRVDSSPVSKSVLIVTKKGNTLCYDSWTDRYFRSDMETIRKAVNDFNAQVINDTYASLSDFYHLVDLPSTKESDYIGWSTDKLLQIEDPASAVVSEDGEPAIVLDFRTKPNGRFTSAY